MDLKVKNGKRDLKLEKGERNAVVRTRGLCGELARLPLGHVSEAAEIAARGLALILAEPSPAEGNGKASESGMTEE